MQKLISFIIPTRRLDNLREFFENLEATTSDYNTVEVLVKLDDDHEGALEFIEAEIKKRPFKIQYIRTPRLEGVFSLWIGTERLFFMSDPESYFVQVMSDEPRFKTMHWDKILRNYVGFFKDDVFRLRLSSMKFANYATHYECTFRPDSFPIYTRRWLELTEGIGDCWGSDAYQQCVAFQLSLGPGSYLNHYREDALCRDVVVYDIEMGGLEFGVGVSPEENKIRHKQNLKEWARLTSFIMQEHFSYLARRMNAYIWAKQEKIDHFKLIKCDKRKTVAIIDASNKQLLEFSYAVPRLFVYTQNITRFITLVPKRMALRCLRMINIIMNKFRSNNSSSEKQTETTSALKKMIKKRIKTIMITIKVPVNMICEKIDALFKSSPPGIGVKGEKLEWVRQELKDQEEKRWILREKSFM